MANSSGIKAGQAYIELLVKDGQMVKALENASKKLKSFGTAVSGIGAGMAAAGAAVAGPMAAMAKSFATAGAAIFDASKRTGFSAEALSELQHGANQTGASIEDLESGLAKMSKTVTGAAMGSSKAAEAFGVLGLNVADLAGMNPEEKFSAIAEALSGVADPTLRSALAMKIFGGAGQKLLPMMADGAAGLAAMREQARALGLTITTDAAASADKLDDAFGDLSASSSAAARAVGEALAGSFTEFVQATTAVVVKVGAWIKQNKDLVLSVFKIAGTVAIVGTAITGIGGAILGFSAALGAVASGVTAAVGVLSGMASVATALLSPILVLTAGVAGLGAYLLYTSGAGAQALAWLAAKFGDLQKTATTAFKGIADALSAGDISLAATILWSGLQLAWLDGTKELSNVWAGFKAGFVQVAAGAFYGTLDIWTRVSSGLEAAWKQSAAAFKSTWSKAVSATTGIFEAGARAIMKRQVDLQVALGKLTQEKGEEQKAFIDQQFDKQGNVRKQEESSAEIDAQQKLNNDLKRIEAEKQKTLNDLRAAETQLSSAASANSESEKAALTKRITDLKKQLSDLNSKASKQAAAGSSQSPPISVPQIKNKIAGIGDLLAGATAAKFQVAGTFNAEQSRGLGAGDARNQVDKKMIALLERIAEGVEDFTEPTFEE